MNGKPHQGKSVLLVDDEVDILSTYSILLEMHGFDVMTAANGQEALAAVAERKPDIIISDCMMPVMDGIELLWQLRSKTETAGIPVILFSAVPPAQDLSKAGIQHFMLKPVKFTEMLKKIHQLIK